MVDEADSGEARVSEAALARVAALGGRCERSHAMAGILRSLARAE